MARLVILLALIAFIVLVTVEARKKDQWKNKKSHRDLKGDYVNALMKKKNTGLIAVDTKDIKYEVGGNLMKSKWRKSKGKGKGKGKHRNRHKMKKFGGKAGKIKKNMPWLNILSEEDCKAHCKYNEVCIMGPLDAKPLCVFKGDVKRSVKLFRKFQRKERKAWKKFQKKNYAHLKKKDIFGFKVGKATKKSYKMEKPAMPLEKKEYGKETVEEKPQTYDMKTATMIPMDPVEEGSEKAKMCGIDEFDALKNRIMGWFHVLHSKDKRVRKQDRAWRKAHRHSVKKVLEINDKCQCMKSAVWEFAEMDVDKNGVLSVSEMHDLEENTNEPCVKPYLNSCDKDMDGKLSADEWCCCFSNILGPCYQNMDAVRRSKEPVSYMPRCDREGYYLPEQCEGMEKKDFTCWCVDYNGNMLDGTKALGRADCSKYEKHGSYD